MKQLKLLFAGLFLSIFSLGCASTGQDEFRPLWDGQTLQGWHEIGAGSWSIEDGILIGTHKASEERHGHLVTDKIYDDFTVRVVYKAVKGNSGLYFRTEETSGPVGVEGFQAEIDATKDAGGLYETGGRTWVVQPNAEEVAQYFRPNKWNEMTVSAQGRDVVVHVNGTKTAELTNDPGRLEGRLMLQLHGGQDMEVHIKSIEIKGEPVQ